MARGPRYRVPFRRRREGRTDYRRRLGMLRGETVRAVVRASNRQTKIQFTTFSTEGDRVTATAVSSELRALGWEFGTGNVPAAYLTGLLAGRRAKAAGVTSAVLDIGRRRGGHGSRVYAALRGILDAGVSVPHDPKVLPTDDRVTGAHIAANETYARADRARIVELVQSLKAKVQEAPP